jgi:Trk K+ transport system NAD-binding subunit
VIDTDEDRLARAAEVRTIVVVQGDGSSRVVLDQAGLGQADALVAASNNDAVNLEACRLALDAGLLRVVAVAADPEQLADYRELKLPAFSPDRLTARRIEINLEPRRLHSAAFADGMAEAIEFRIASDSPLRGRALKELHSESWLVAAILRQGRLIVPHGESVLQVDDLVTVVGAASDFSTIVRTFSTAEARFPIDFGKHVAVWMENERDLTGPVAEAFNITRNSAAESLLVVHPDPAAVSNEAQAEVLNQLIEQVTQSDEEIDVVLRGVDPTQGGNLLSVAEAGNVGVLVAARPIGGRPVRRRRISKLLRVASRANVPILLASSQYPYQRIVTPARDTPAGRAAGRAAIDLAVYANLPVIGVAVVPPAFIAGEDVKSEAVRAIARLREEAAVQGVTVKRRIRQGNPVRGLQEMVGSGGLLVLGYPRRIPTTFAPGIVGHLVERSTSSTLLIPSEE